jgi:hypothetical protein
MCLRNCLNLELRMLVNYLNLLRLLRWQRLSILIPNIMKLMRIIILWIFYSVQVNFCSSFILNVRIEPLYSSDSQAKNEKGMGSTLGSISKISGRNLFSKSVKKKKSPVVGINRRKKQLEEIKEDKILSQMNKDFNVEYLRDVETILMSESKSPKKKATFSPVKLPKRPFKANAPAAMINSKKYVF